MKIHICLLTLSAFFSTLTFAADNWESALSTRFKSLSGKEAGTLGVFVERVKDGKSASFQADRDWYLSSTTKVPVAIVLLKKVESGEITLEQNLILKQSDFVDGSGEVIWKEPGASLSVAYLLEKMLTQSDSTATDMLIRLIGEKSLNDFLAAEGDFGPFTTLLQVRYDAYGELSNKASALTNMDFIEFKKAKGMGARLNAFLLRTGAKRSELKAPSITAAFERYYAKGINSSTLVAYGAMLEKLNAGAYLKPENTALVLDHMSKMTTGENRMKAGFPPGTKFAQKTGTQIARICNVGLVNPGAEAIVVAACVEKFKDQAKAESMLKNVGAAIGKAGIL